MLDQAVISPCLLEFQEPTIAAAMSSLLRSGVGHVTIAPLLLFSAGHAKSDIPDAVADCLHDTPLASRPKLVQCRPISRQSELVRAVRERLCETLQHRPQPKTSQPGGVGAETAIVMVGRGSRDPCATTDMRLLSEVVVNGRLSGETSLGERFSIAPANVFTTFYAMAEPRLPKTLSQLAGSGKYHRILVYPHLLFAGRLFDSIAGQVGQAKAEYPRIQFELSSYLGPTDFISRAIAARIRETAAPRIHSA